MKNTPRNLAALLALAAAHCLPASAIAATTTTANVNGALSFNVASNPLGGLANCNIIVGSHNYGSASFTTGNAATYSFTGTAQVGTSDSFLALYKNSFNPANPTANLVGCDDDSAGGRLPQFVANLDATTTYVMVATTFPAQAFTGSVTFSAGVVPNITLAPLSVSIVATGQSMVATSDSPMPISYVSSNPSVATIDPATGAVTLLAGGSTLITASQSAQADPLPFAAGKKTAMLTVTLLPNNMALAPQSAPVGATGKSMVATSDSPAPISYASSNPAVATIDPATGALTLLSAGTTTITASQAAQAGFAAATKTALLTVTRLPANITLAPASAAVGATGKTMVATSDSPAPISYASSNPAVAAIDPATGALTLLSAGTTTITASQAAQAGFDAGTQTALLTVTAAPVPVPQPVPTLSEWAMMLMASLLAMAGVRKLRRRA
ncbi:IPTL-CTERM sorting domain protein [Delftia acidovorans]|nr:IPTL-CTERM sorting domain protein [Delftia acidovorans]